MKPMSHKLVLSLYFQKKLKVWTWHLCLFLISCGLSFRTKTWRRVCLHRQLSILVKFETYHTHIDCCYEIVKIPNIVCFAIFVCHRSNCFYDLIWNILSTFNCCSIGFHWYLLRNNSNTLASCVLWTVWSYIN